MSTSGESIRRFVLERFERSLDLPLDQVLDLDPALVVVSELEAMRIRASSGELAEFDPASGQYDPGLREALIEDMVDALKRYLYQRNQFLAIPQEVIPRVRANYERFLDQSVAVIRHTDSANELAARLSPVVRSHIATLNRELSGLLPQMPKVEAGAEDHYGSYPCSEYSPRLQLQLLGEDDIHGRVLDVGCGRTGALVLALRQAGVDAYGLDRVVPDGPHFYHCDWFGFEFQPESWDTVISHMALSNHIVHQLAGGKGDLAKYGALYAKILGSLRAGGRFIYAPGLPFLEQLLAGTGYTVAGRRISYGDLKFTATVVRRDA